MLHPALETRELTVVYGTDASAVVALQKASVRVRRGEVVALLGPSGAGKSTFLRCAGLVSPPTSGQIFLDGVAVVDGPHALQDLRRLRREGIGFVFQKSNLIPFLNALENVQVAGELTGEAPRVVRQRARELLDLLGVATRAHHMPVALSGGEQQRITIARALINRPGLLLADEPTAALDSVRGRQVMELFRDAARRHNAGVIVVTHDHRALDVFDAIWSMEDGVIRQGVTTTPHTSA